MIGKDDNKIYVLAKYPLGKDNILQPKYYGKFVLKS